MLKSIQWKLVIISFLLVWLAMSITGVFVTEQFKKIMMDEIEKAAVANGERFAETLSDYLNDSSADSGNIENMGKTFYDSLGKQVESVAIYNVRSGYKPAFSNKNFQAKSIINSYLYELYEKHEIISRPEVNDEFYIYNLIPIHSPTDNEEIIGALYLGVNLTSVKDRIKDIRIIITSATVLALCITVLLGIILARTITGPIKEVTSKAEQLAKGEYGQVIEVKSHDEVGQLTEMFNYMTSRLKNTLEEVYNEKNKVDTILTHMTDGIIAVSNDGTIIHTNPAVFNLLNIKTQELVDKSFDEFSKELDLGIFSEDLFSGSEKNYNILSFNNSIIKLNCEPFKNEKNETNGVIVVLQDITEQEKLDKMRKEFVANVSHELRTPLTTIKSYAETLLDGALENKEYAVNFLRVINSESDRMTRLVKDLLQLSKHDYDNMQWNMKNINIAGIIQDCVDKLVISAKQKEQELIYIPESDSIEIYGDKDRMEQLIINIISNAIKYTPDNGLVKVTLTKDYEYTTIKVSDNGIGIPREDLPRLFERFYRVDKARSRGMGGTGLGLSIAKQIVEAHNGRINIESEYGSGTEVTIQLPNKH